jgi:diguanylate cyclase (GGDEF)-like protein
VDASWSPAGDTRALQRLLTAVQELSLVQNLAEIQSVVRTAARELTGCDGATFVLRDDDCCYYADEDAIAPLWKGSRFPLGDCISGWAMMHRRPAVIPDIYADARIPHAAYRPTFVKSLVMVPIRTLDPVGAIGNYWAHERQPTTQEISLLQALADSTSVAMENVRVHAELERRVQERTAALEQANEEIHRLLMTDDLTGLVNRRGFHVLAGDALRAARTHGRTCALAYLDVDGLKQVNDEAGHAVGDALIADVAAALGAAVGPSDIVARLGGDEFCVLAVDPDPVRLKSILLAALQDPPVIDRPYQLSASIGVTTVSAADDSSLDDLLARADRLMYADKKSKPAPVLAS